MRRAAIENHAVKGIHLALAALLTCGGGVAATAAEEGLRPREDAPGGYRIANLDPSRLDPSVPVLSARGAALGGASRLPPDLALMAKELLERGEGGGADVFDLAAIQTDYSNPQDGNVVLLTWQESIANAPDSLTLYLDQVEIEACTAFAPLPAGQVPGDNFTFVCNVEAGRRSFLLEANDGAFAEVDITVLEEQPFEDPENFSCEAGAVNLDQNGMPDGTCQILLGWTKLPPFPTTLTVLLGGTPLGNLPGDGLGRYVTLIDAPPGESCFGLLGFLETEEGVYRGSLVETCCTVTCDPLSCFPVTGLDLHQTGYGALGEVTAFWFTNGPDVGSGPYQEVRGFLNGQLLGALPGSPGAAVFNGLAPGSYTFGIQGVCDRTAGDIATNREETLMTFLETPHASPVTRAGIDCEFSEAERTLTATWTNEDPSMFLLAFLAPGGDRNNLAFLGFLPGDTEEIVLAPMAGGVPPAATDVVVCQFFTVIDGSCYGSELIGCDDPAGGNSFVRMVCNAVVPDPENPTPTITSALFVFNFLFQNGPVPPCMAACDANEDTQVNLTDGLFILNYQFQNGPAPDAWPNVLTPVCEEADAADCAESHSFCP
jgi:hypothetical protein